MCRKDAERFLSLTSIDYGKSKQLIEREWKNDLESKNKKARVDEELILKELYDDAAGPKVPDHGTAYNMQSHDVGGGEESLRSVLPDRPEPGTIIDIQPAGQEFAEFLNNAGEMQAQIEKNLEN